MTSFRPGERREAADEAVGEVEAMLEAVDQLDGVEVLTTEVIVTHRTVG